MRLSLSLPNIVRCPGLSYAELRRFSVRFGSLFGDSLRSLQGSSCLIVHLRGRDTLGGP